MRQDRNPCAAAREDGDQSAEDLWDFGWEDKNHPWADTGSSRRQSCSLRQQSHPARFVAGAGNLWHASAHKGNPLFRRWVPAPNTVDPEGSPGGSRLRHARRQETLRGERENHRSVRLALPAVRGEIAFSPRGHGPRGAHAVARRDRHAGVPHGDAGSASRRQGWPAKSLVSVPISSPWAMSGGTCVKSFDGGLTMPGARCPCSRGSGCTTRRRRSCRCAGAWPRRTPGRPVPPVR